MIGQAVVGELLKLRRLSMLWWTLLAMLAGPLGVALLIWIAQDPERAARAGLLGAKADLAAVQPTWPAFSTFVVLIIGSAGWLMLAFIVSTVFGREYAERTAPALFTFPVPRSRLALAKFIVIAAWWLVIAAAALAEAILVGHALGLTGWTALTVPDLVGRTASAAAATWLVGTPLALVAVLARGYLAPLGTALALLLGGQLLNQTGWGDWLPWSMLSRNGEPPGLGGWIVVALTGVAGVLATVVAYRLADNP